MSLKKRFYVWAMLAIALAFFQPLKAENYGAEVSTDGASVDVSQLYSNPPTATTNIKSRIVVKNGVPFSITLPANSNPSGVNGATLSGTTIQVSEAGSVSFYHHKDGIEYYVLVHVNYYGVLQYQGGDAPASIDVTLDNQNQTLSVPAGKFPGIVWFNGSGEELENIPRGTESVSLSAFLATNNTSFKVRLRDGTSNALPNGIGGGESWCEFTLVDKRTPATVSVTGVTLNESAKTLTVGETFQLTPNVQPPTATDPGVTWSVAPAGIVAVGTSGLVTAQAQGQATVTVKTNDGNHTAQCVVTVVPKKHRVHFSHTGSGALTATVDNAPIQTGAEVEAGKTVVFTAAPAEGHRVKAWTPANGTATTYTVTNLSAETTVTVAFEAIPAPPPTPSPVKHRVHFSHTGSGALTATVDNAPIQTGDEVEAGKTVVFTAAPAEGHRVKAWTPANGTATTYTVTNLSAETTVTVAFEAIPAPPPPTPSPTPNPTPDPEPPTPAPTPKKVEKLTLNHPAFEANGIASFRLEIVEILPTDAADKSVTWATNNPSVATVDAQGLVTIHKKGKATLTATARDGSGVNATCLLDVISTVANETVDGLRVYAAGGALHLTLPKAETVHLYHVSGAMVKTLALPSGDHVQPLPSGVYLVRVGERVTKILVK